MIKGMTLPKAGNRLPLILGLVLGLVAAVLVVVVLTGSKDSGNTTSKSSGGAGVPVVVAASDIAAGTRLSAEMLAPGEVSQEDLLPGAFTTTEGLVGQVTRVSLVKGEQVIQTKVVNTQTIGEFGGNPPLSLLVQPGTRAVSAQMSSLIGAGGNVRPGDFVDVILVVEVNALGPDGQAFSDTVAGTILQNVKVLAIDTERANPDPEAATDPDAAKSENEAATTVTLSLSPSQSEVLAVADQCGVAHNGRLAISLRGPGDPNRLSNRSEWPADGPLPSCVALLGVSNLGE
jgi:pilus assembly protein CpaB